VSATLLATAETTSWLRVPRLPDKETSTLDVSAPAEDVCSDPVGGIDISFEELFSNDSESVGLADGTDPLEIAGEVEIDRDEGDTGDACGPTADEEDTPNVPATDEGDETDDIAPIGDDEDDGEVDTNATDDTGTDELEENDATTVDELLAPEDEMGEDDATAFDGPAEDDDAAVDELDDDPGEDDDEPFPALASSISAREI
jgi:hypothetical protein